MERRCGRLHGQPRSRTPLDGQRDEHATGRRRWGSIAWRGLPLWEWVGRRQWAPAGTHRAGRYAGNPRRSTDRPTAERLLAALQDITLTIIKGSPQTKRQVTALRPLHQRMLAVVGFSSALYTGLCTVASEPP